MGRGPSVRALVSRPLMPKFIVSESYLYQVEAADADAALDAFQEYAQADMSEDAALYYGVKFLENQTEVEDLD